MCTTIFTTVMFFDCISNDVYDLSKYGSVINIGDLNSRIGNLLDYIGRKELFYLTTHSTHFIYGYMASYIW